MSYPARAEGLVNMGNNHNLIMKHLEMFVITKRYNIRIEWFGFRGPESDGNEGVLRITQSSSIPGVSPSDCLVSYLGHSLGKSYPSAKKQSVYSTAPADWTTMQSWVEKGFTPLQRSSQCILQPQLTVQKNWMKRLREGVHYTNDLIVEKAAYSWHAS